MEWESYYRSYPLMPPYDPPPRSAFPPPPHSGQRVDSGASYRVKEAGKSSPGTVSVASNAACSGVWSAGQPAGHGSSNSKDTEAISESDSEVCDNTAYSDDTNTRI